MNIVVCVKRTLDSETRVRLDPRGMSIDAHGARYVVGQHDEFALEAALLARARSGRGSVIAVSFGDESSTAQLRSCLAKGADRAVLLEGAPTADGLGTARALANEPSVADAPLILCGLRSTDEGRQQVGPMLATLLDRPCVTGVIDFELADDGVVCRRVAEGGVETWETDLPAVLTMARGGRNPRAPSLRDVMGAEEKPLAERAALPAPSRVVIEKLEYGPARAGVRILGEGPEAVPELVRLLQKEAGVGTPERSP